MIVDLFSGKVRGSVVELGSTAGLHAIPAVVGRLAEIDAVTMAKIEVLCLRDGISLARFVSIAVDAYALMLPGLSPPRE